MAGAAHRYAQVILACETHRLAYIVGTSAAGSPDVRLPGHVEIKGRVNAITLALAEDFRRDSYLFGEGVRDPRDIWSEFWMECSKEFSELTSEGNFAQALNALSCR